MNVKELRDEMTAVFEQLRDEKIETKRAHELSNAAGKILGTVGIQLKYCLQRGDIPKIEFLEVGESVARTLGEKEPAEETA